MKLDEVLMSNYMPYAHEVIVDRAIPGIDGMKPSHRKILYTMHEMNLYERLSKCANIVGTTMQLHPHGDQAIYGTLIRMTTGNKALLTPYITSKGNFGNYSFRDLQPAAARYTEAKLAPISKELFEGINENAVNMVDNYDNTRKEPELLPVKFPSILTNASTGVAVGIASSIPSYPLREVCDATIGILNGSITTAEELVEVLLAPEFPTGGHIHGSKADYINLAKTGRATFTLSGLATTYQNCIIINEVPYNTTVEAIVDKATELAKTELKEISDIRDESDLKGMRVVIELKRNSDSDEVLKKLMYYTTLRTTISYNCNLIIDNRPLCQGLLAILHEWISFRMNCIQRQYQFKLAKRSAQEHLLATWERIESDLDFVVKTLTTNQEEMAKAILGAKFDLDKEQIDYLFDMKIRDITVDKMAKKLKDLADAREDMAKYKSVIESDSAKKELMRVELDEISKKHGGHRKTQMLSPIVKEIPMKKEDIIDDTIVTVIYTTNGMIKRLVNQKDYDNFYLTDGDRVKNDFVCPNTETLLVWTRKGTCYKIPVNNIDASKGTTKELLNNTVDLEQDDEIVKVCIAGNYKGNFKIVYNNGRGRVVYLSKVSGNRSKYIHCYDAMTDPYDTVTDADIFFIITANRKAAYANLTSIIDFNARAAFKVARIDSNDHIFGIQPISEVPDMSKIDLGKYVKGYCVKIRDDVLWETDQDK